MQISHTNSIEGNKKQLAQQRELLLRKTSAVINFHTKKGKKKKKGEMKHYVHQHNKTVSILHTIIRIQEALVLRAVKNVVDFIPVLDLLC